MTTEEKIKEPFFKDVTDWENYLPLMYYAMQAIPVGDVVECGVGNGGSVKIHDYCEHYKRVLYSFETDEEWMNQFIHLQNDNHKFRRIINDWHIVKDICPEPAVVLVDSAPGELRRLIIKRYSDFKGILVVHDTQTQPTAADYGYDSVWSYFKYKVDLQVTMNYDVDPPHNRTWASAVSNHFDVTQWKGLETGNPDYKII